MPHDPVTADAIDPGEPDPLRVAPLEELAAAFLAAATSMHRAERELHARRVRRRALGRMLAGRLIDERPDRPFAPFATLGHHFIPHRDRSGVEKHRIDSATETTEGGGP